MVWGRRRKECLEYVPDSATSCGECGKSHPRFRVSEYLDRIEQVHLEILEQQKPVNHEFVLWWGLDGLRLNEDGTTEWITRKKPELVQQLAPIQPCQTGMLQNPFSMCQNTAATREQIYGLKMQSEMASYNVALQYSMHGFNQALQGQLQYPVYYPHYLYGGVTGCCCDRTIFQ